MNLFARLCWLRLGQIHAHDRRSFGESVTFENFLREAFLETFGQIERKFFRAGDDEPQTAELVRLGFAQIAAQKCRRRQQQCQFIALDQRRVLRRFERIWISDDAHAFDERIPKRDGRSEAVKERERRENGVVPFRVEKFPELGDIADDIAMAEHDPFWFARASACEEQGCFCVTASFWNLQKPQQ